jgi:hypothetical protein
MTQLNCQISHYAIRKKTDSCSNSFEPRHRVEEISLTVARPFIERWHYSGKTPTGKNVFFGWYIGEELYAVADYGIGVNSVQAEFLSRITQKNVTQANLYELKRLCRTEPAITGYPLTQFLARCHKSLKRDHGIRFIVSFSDPEHNRFADQADVPYSSGGIYKAGNFEYLGKTNAEIHVVDATGIKRHRRYPCRYMERQRLKGVPITMEQAREKLGLRPIKTEPKDRWFLDLGEPKRQARFSRTRSIADGSPTRRETAPGQPTPILPRRLRATGNPADYVSGHAARMNYWRRMRSRLRRRRLTQTWKWLD